MAAKAPRYLPSAWNTYVGTNVLILELIVEDLRTLR